MTIEQYERTYEQNEDLGLNDMKTENYETSWPLHTLRQQKNIKPGPLCHFNSKIIRCSHQRMLQTNKISWITAMKVHKTVGGGVWFFGVFFFFLPFLIESAGLICTNHIHNCLLWSVYSHCHVYKLFNNIYLYVYHRYMDFVSVSRE